MRRSNTAGSSLKIVIVYRDILTAENNPNAQFDFSEEASKVVWTQMAHFQLFLCNGKQCKVLSCC